MEAKQSEVGELSGRVRGPEGGRAPGDGVERTGHRRRQDPWVNVEASATGRCLTRHDESLVAGKGAGKLVSTGVDL